MNGTPDPNYPQAATAGTYGNPASESPTTGASYGSTGAYGSAGPGYAGTASDPYAAGYVPPAGAGVPPGYVPPPAAAVSGSPNPGLAACLGFIPGVGAMYNGQFAKGIAHILIFSVLTSLSHHMGDPLDMVFGLLVAGWYFYMVFDAYQTARARRDGLVVPDPFGLNNIGERFGMPTNPNWGDFVARPAPGTPPADARTSNPYAGPASIPVVDPVTGAPTSADPAYPPPPYSAGYAAQPPFAPNYAPNYGGSYAGAAADPRTYTAAYGTPGAYAAAGAAPPPFTNAYGSVYAPADPAFNAPYPVPPPSSGIPSGAIWLIGLGLLALLGTLGHNYYFVPRYFGGVIPIVLGIGLIIQRALSAKRFYPEGSAAHSWYILHQSRFGILLVAVGGLTLLSSLGVLFWSHSWPYLLILFGLLQVADRAAYNRVIAEGPLPAPYSATTTSSTSAAESSSAASTSTATGNTTAEEAR